jgi:hypothetical protein
MSSEWGSVADQIEPGIFDDDEVGAPIAGSAPPTRSCPGKIPIDHVPILVRR